MKKLVNWWIGGPDIEDCITAGFDDVTPPATPKRPWGWKPTKNKLLALVESLSTNASISVTCVANGTVIPHDVFSTILEFLGVLDVVTCMKVSRGWFCNSLDDNTWRMLFRRSFVHPQESSHTKNITTNFKGRHFYSLFKRKTKIDRTRRAQVFSASRLTVEWSYRCPLSWYDLDPVANKPRRRQGRVNSNHIAPAPPFWLVLFLHRCDIVVRVTQKSNATQKKTCTSSGSSQRVGVHLLLLVRMSVTC
eukprot:TRINITY_DN65243_c0_g1_i4.p1 TRINITY_DN65243_c0_g1~~TRINITY_DN65243_c0_g1_i4.p1  ORF type:complete len:256 (-),score=12.29 TRINITY_DN65243_c0_g1_i4:346-1092(-)